MVAVEGTLGGGWAAASIFTGYLKRGVVLSFGFCV
jgi:hypothetical protein